MKVVWQVEKDPYCQKVLKKHWPEVPCYGDIKEIDFAALPSVDLICGGFPCQPVSCAGKRLGDKDERWLWPEFYRAICEARPRWVLVENVPGLLSASDGRLFGGILGDLARSGYDAEWDLLPAAAFGAPHLRFRLFLVAHTRSGPGIGGALSPGREEERGVVAGGTEDVAHPDEQPLGGGFCPDESRGEWGRRSGDSHCTGDATHAQCQRLQGGIFQKRGEGTPDLRRRLADSDWWLIEPDVGRVAHGVFKRVDRLKCLGNAVVPQVVEWIGNRILEIEIF
jgi:DNA (cytosine-5)-methyltransferase 1